MCPIRIYNPSKPYKFGIEVFQACDLETYYCYDFIICDKLPGPELHTWVVKELVANVPYEHHHIVLDRGFTSPKVLIWLRSQGYNGTGTIVANRVGYPSTMITLDNHAVQGTFRCAIAPSDGLIAVCWKHTATRTRRQEDKKPVFFLSTCHGVNRGVVSRLQNDGRRADVVAPECAVVYNLHKDAVDQYDKYCLKTNYSIQKQSKAVKWWHRAWWGLFDGAVGNMWVCFVHANPTYTRMEFVLKLQEQLVHNTLNARPVGESTRSAEARNAELQPGEARGRGRKSYFWCEPCNVYLCKDACFQRYHTDRAITGIDVGAKRKRRSIAESV
eukprot:jgi/Chlat1/612/Chrsp103S01034